MTLLSIMAVCILIAVIVAGYCWIFIVVPEKIYKYYKEGRMSQRDYADFCERGYFAVVLDEIGPPGTYKNG